MDLFSFYADNALIKKATSADETPTPGYLFHEIVGITHKSVEACQNLENVLLSRLENESPIVKLKALRTIKHILLKGHISVKRDLMGRVTSIRACLNAKGAPDPLRGDALWRSVRTEAQDVVTIIFDTEQRANPAAPIAISSMGSDQMGFSNASSSTHNLNSSNAANSNFESAHANYIKSSATSSYTNHPGSGSSSSAGHGFGSNQGTNATGPFTQDIKNKISSLPSKFAPNTRPSNELSNFGSIQSVSHASSNTVTTAGGSDWSYAPPAAPAHASGDEEVTVVDDITNAGGSPTLSFQALDQFCVRCALLDQYRVAELLIKKFESRMWQVRHKALTAIEALLLSSSGSVIRDTCIDQRGAFEGLLSAMQAATREKAKQVLTLLGVTIAVESLPSTPTQNPSPTTHAPRIFSSDSPAPSSEAAPSSLFAGLSMGTSSAAPAEPELALTSNAPQSQPQPQPTSAPLIDIESSEEETKLANTSLLSFLEASAKVPPSPTPMRELVHSAHVNESDDSPLISTGPSSLLSFQTPSPLHSSNPDTNPSLLIDLGNDTPATPQSPDLLSNFRTPSVLHSSAPLPSTSSEFEFTNSTSSFAHLLETPAPSSLAELLEATGTTILSPSAPVAPIAPNTSSLSSSPSSSPFAPPPKMPMTSKPLKPAASTIPHYPPTQANTPPGFIPLLTSTYPSSVPAPGSIRTTSSTSVYAPLTSVPRAVSTATPSLLPTSPSTSSSSSFNFVQQKKQDHFGDLVSIQIQQMNSK